MTYYDNQQISSDTQRALRNQAEQHRLAQQTDYSTGTTHLIQEFITKNSRVVTAVIAMIVLLAFAGVSSAQSNEIENDMGVGDPASASFILGFNALHRGDYELALEQFSDSIEYGPTRAASYAFRAATYYMMEEHEAALVDFDTALELSPEYSSVYHWRGMTYFAMGDNEQALTDVQTAIEIQPDYAEAYETLSQIYAAQGNHDQAEIALAQFHAMSESNA